MNLNSMSFIYRFKKRYKKNLFRFFFNSQFLYCTQSYLFGDNYFHNEGIYEILVLLKGEKKLYEKSDVIGF